MFTVINGLNDFLPYYRRNTTFSLEFAPHQSIKHLIESLGIPHTDFGRTVVNGQEVQSSSLLHEGDEVTVYPADYLLGDNPSFILDNHLGQLAIYLRMLGLDSLYRNDFQDNELAEIASRATEGSGAIKASGASGMGGISGLAEENKENEASEPSDQKRALLTRDRRLLMRKAITVGYCLHHTDPRQQAVEVLRRFKLNNQVKPFQRCLRCNTPLRLVSKEEVIDRLEPLTKLYYDEFRICPTCKQIYWKGSHYGHMQELIAELESMANDIGEEKPS